MASLTVVYDACTLYSAPMRDLLMHLALTDLFRAKWTEAIHAEWIKNLLKDRPDLTSEQLERTRQLMNAHVRDCLVEGYAVLIPHLSLPDPDDRHVLAAALHTNATTILTYNLKDFPTSILDPYGIEAQHPDEFISQLIELEPGVIYTAVHRLRTSLRNPPITLEKYLAILEQQALPKTVSLLRKFGTF